MKTALVTGASEGIGRSFAEQLAKEGYKVTAVARNEEKLKELVAKLGTEHKLLKADLSTEAGQELVMGELQSNSYNLLINNAGVGTVGKFTDISFEKQMAMFHLNCEALLKLTYTFLKSAKKGDALINVSSALAFMPSPTMALYCATKSFVTALSESLWFEYKGRGVYVMGLCPGITETQFQISAGGKKEDLPKGLSQTPDHVAKVAIEALHAKMKPTIFTGYKNVIFAGMSRILPRKNLVTMTGGMMKSPSAN